MAECWGRFPLTGTVVGASQEWGEGAYQTQIPVQIVEDQRNGLLPMLHVLWSGLVELLEERRDGVTRMKARQEKV